MDEAVSMGVIFDLTVTSNLTITILFRRQEKSYKRWDYYKSCLWFYLLDKVNWYGYNK